MNYTSAVKAVGGTATRATYRRQYAGGFWAAGGRITHIRATERKRVAEYRLTSATGEAVTNTTPGTNCTGVTKEEIYDNRSDGRGGTYLWYKIIALGLDLVNDAQTNSDLRAIWVVDKYHLMSVGSQ